MNHPNVTADCDTPTYTAIELSGGDLDGERIRVRAKLSAGGPIEVNYLEGDGWQATQWLHTDGTESMLIAVGKLLAADACQVPRDSFRCRSQRVEA